MAIHLEANYAKKLGLPNFSSHQYSVKICTELTDLSQVEAESAKLYRMLQDAVDREIVEVGYMPDATVYGMKKPQNGNGNGNHPTNGSGNGSNNGQHHNGNGADHWNCTEGQAAFVKRLVNENNLDKREVEDMAQQLFGCGVKQCDRMQASQLIEDLLERCGKKVRRTRPPSRYPVRQP